MKYELHRWSCQSVIQQRPTAEWSDGSYLTIRKPCNCDGPKRFEALMTAARDEIQSRNAMGALQMAVAEIEKCAD